MWVPCSPTFPLPPPLLLPNASSPALCSHPSRALRAGINHPFAALKDEPIACLAAGDHRGNHTSCRPLRAEGGGDATLRQRFIYLISLG